ncbi:protein JINGUBANG-like [Zingiber officinale]|uniref:Neurobeachin beta-propeller domain-containing protein n=1 Tax=Zingiber officinale TaxID=94328 RepID=A0A8J5HR73_ZINOF|nr:protein JINGUBANG-like [Zingiber officinale]KAG6520056.1 hypothetical protein ZIOFF_017086 [Zingiber officinale]
MNGESIRGCALFAEEGGGLPRTSSFSALLHSDPLIKSASEEDFHGRTSSPSPANPGYFSDHSSHTDDQPSSADSSPLQMSPWNHQPDSDPFFDPANAPPPPPTDLFQAAGSGLVASLVREEDHIYSLAAVGDLLYTGSDSKNIRVWKNQKEFSGFKAASGFVKAIVISNDHCVFTGHQDGKVRLWKASPKDPRIHKHVGTLPRFKDLIKCSFNPSNYVEAAHKRHHHRSSALWIRHHDAVSCLCLSEDQSLIYSGSWDRTLKVWRVEDMRCVESINAHDDAINAVALGFDNMVLTGSADGTVKVWKPEQLPKPPMGNKKGNGKKPAAAFLTRHEPYATLVRQDMAITALVVNSAAGMVYAGSSDGGVSWWDHRGVGGDAGSGGVIRGHKVAVLCLAAAGSLVFSGSADKTLCVWRREAGGVHVCLSVLTGHTGPVKCLAVEANQEKSKSNGRWVVYSGSLDKSVKVWKIADNADSDCRCSAATPHWDLETTLPCQQTPNYDMY